MQEELLRRDGRKMNAIACLDCIIDDPDRETKENGITIDWDERDLMKHSWVPDNQEYDVARKYPCPKCGSERVAIAFDWD